MKRLLIALMFLVLPDSKAVEKKTVELKLTVLVEEDSEIFIGKKKITIDEIPEEGVIADLQISNNKVKKVIFEEKK